MHNLTIISQQQETLFIIIALQSARKIKDNALINVVSENFDLKYATKNSIYFARLRETELQSVKKLCWNICTTKIRISAIRKRANFNFYSFRFPRCSSAAFYCFFLHTVCEFVCVETHVVNARISHLLVRFHDCTFCCSCILR